LLWARLLSLILSRGSSGTWIGDWMTMRLLIVGGSDAGISPARVPAN